MKKTVILALCASSLGLGACGLDVPDLNNPSLESLQTSPTPSGVYAASTGLLIGNRSGKSAQNGYVGHLGLLGRESYTFDAADPRYVTEMLAGASLDPGSPAFGGSLWSPSYANIRNANTVLAALDKVSGVSNEAKEAIRGFAKTSQAMDFLVIVTTRDTNGGPIDVGGDFNTLAPIETKERMLEHISNLLDEAKGHLQAGGDAFPFPLSSGYEGFDTPATYLTFNRAIKARVEVYRKNWDAALTALGESFLDTNESLTLGVYHAYGTGSGDATNGLTSPNVFAHPSIVTDAELKADGTTVDDRVTRKIKTVNSRTYQGLTSDLQFRMYESNSAPVPIIRNEELILLRAEIYINQDNLTDAETDINFIRTTSGGLEPVTLVGENAIDTLLYERRYSLLFEGGHRWIDMRRYNRLDQLPRDGENHVVHDKFPIPVSETDARK